jgi:hypothetical protein
MWLRVPVCDDERNEYPDPLVDATENRVGPMMRVYPRNSIEIQLRSTA